MFQASKVLPYSANFLKEIAADIEQYPTFLPMLKSVAIYPKTDAFFETDVTIGTGLFEKTYRLEVFIFDDAVEAKAMPNHTVRFLEFRWHFTNYENNRCLVSFSLEFKLQSALLHVTVGKFLDSSAQTLLTAFEQRAARLWPQPEDSYGI